MISNHAIRILYQASRKPFPAQEVNPGVSQKLVALGYVNLVEMPSPYPSHKRGTKVHFLVPTDAGKAFVSDEKIFQQRVSRNAPSAKMQKLLARVACGEEIFDDGLPRGQVMVFRALVNRGLIRAVNRTTPARITDAGLAALAAVEPKE